MSTVTVNPYQEVPEVTKSKKEQHLRFTTSAPFAPTYVHSIISEGRSNPDVVYTNRIQNRQVALENPAKKSRAKELADQRKARQALDKARRKTRVISRKRAAATGIWSLKPEERSYELFLPLHALWRGYISELLALPPPPAQPPKGAHRMPNVQNMQGKLVKADFHGSILSVRSAKNASLVGVGGIVIEETENTFKVITPKNQLKVIPKVNSTFVFKIPLYASPKSPNPDDNPDAEPTLEFELYGSQFAFRASDRATKKFKHKVIQ